MTLPILPKNLFHFLGLSVLSDNFFCMKPMTTLPGCTHKPNSSNLCKTILILSFNSSLESANISTLFNTLHRLNATILLAPLLTPTIQPLEISRRRFQAEWKTNELILTTFAKKLCQEPRIWMDQDLMITISKFSKIKLCIVFLTTNS